MTIDSFSGRYAFLSNFYPVQHKLMLHFGICGECNLLFDTVEHAYQASKTNDPVQRRMIHLCGTPGTAKKLGRVATMRPDFDSIKDTIMCQLLRDKFAKLPYRQWLLDTGEATLIEGNTWGDKYWGTVNGIGENRLGELLELVRFELHHPEQQGTV